MKSQSSRAESLSKRLLSREHSNALFWENFITSTLWVSSLMDGTPNEGRVNSHYRHTGIHVKVLDTRHGITETV